MKTLRFLLIIGLLVGWPFSAGLPLLAAEKEEDPDEALLKEAKIGTDGPSLLAYVRKLTGKDEDLIQLEKLIRQLGDGSFKVRRQAKRKIIALGPITNTFLFEAKKGSSIEADKGIENCIREINKVYDWGLQPAVVRLLVKKKSRGALPALINFLPYVADEATEEEVWYGADSLAASNGRDYQSLLNALNDPIPKKRALAGYILVRKEKKGGKLKAKQFITDPSPLVRLRVAQGMLAEREKAAIPVLIEILKESPIEIGWQAEELLRWVASEKPPRLTIGPGKKETRKKVNLAWLRWWQKHKDNVFRTPKRKSNFKPGLFFVGDEMGVWLFGCDDNSRFFLKNENKVKDLQLLRDARLLIGEQSGVRFIKSDLSGKPYWKKNIKKGDFLNCQELPNGDTLIASRRFLLEFDSCDKLIFEHPLVELSPSYYITLRKTGRNSYTGLGYDGELKVVKFKKENLGLKKKETILLEKEAEIDSQMNLLPRGGFLITSLHSNRVVEFDRNGKQTNIFRVSRPIFAVRLRNGNTLIGFRKSPENYQIAEYASPIKIIRQIPLKTRPNCIRPCLPLIGLGFLE